MILEQIFLNIERNSDHVNFLTLNFENGSLIHKKNELYIEFRHFFIKQRSSKASR